MRTCQELINLRIIHIVIMLMTAVFIYQYSQWEDGLWIVITVVALIGPFRPGLTLNKARQRILGSIAGLLLSVLFWFLIRYNYNLLIIIAIILIYCIAYSLLQEYTYFIMFVTVMLCINFDYMNLFFNNEIFFIINRIICVFIGIAICQFYEYFVFKYSYTNAINLVEANKLDILVDKTRSDFLNSNSSSVITLNGLLTPLIKELTKLAELKESCLHGYSRQNETLELINEYELKLTALVQQISNDGFALIRANVS